MVRTGSVYTVGAVAEWLWMETVMSEGTGVIKLRVGQQLKVTASQLAPSGAGVVTEHAVSYTHLDVYKRQRLVVFVLAAWLAKQHRRYSGIVKARS